MKQGDKLICLKTINNYINQPLFVKGEEYEVLYLISDDRKWSGNNEDNLKKTTDLDDENIEVCLNHIMYANEYNTWPIKWVKETFKSKQELREETINKIIG